MSVQLTSVERKEEEIQRSAKAEDSPCTVSVNSELSG